MPEAQRATRARHCRWHAASAAQPLTRRSAPYRRTLGSPSSAAAIRFEMPGRRPRSGWRAGPATKGIVPIAPLMPAEIKFFEWYKGGAIRGGVVMAIGATSAAPARAAWSCDCDEAVAAFDLRS